MNSDPAVFHTETIDGLLDAAIAAAKSGDEKRARAILHQVLELDDCNVQAWLWLSSVVDNLDDVEICLNHILAIQPENQVIRERLEWLKKRKVLPSPPLSEPISPAAASQPGQAVASVFPMRFAENDRPLASFHPDDLSLAQLERRVITDPGDAAARREWVNRTGRLAQGELSTPDVPLDQPENLHERQRYTCPTCGGTLRFNPSILGLQCSYCGRIEEVEGRPLQPEDEALDRISGTRLAFGQADRQRLLRCQQCGAISLFPPAQVSVACPYCGSAVLALTTQDTWLKWPQAIIPMQIEAMTACKRAGDWLGTGFFRPSELHKSILQKFSPLYVPVWLITAALSFAEPGGTSLLGRRDYLFTDWVVPGIQHPAGQHISALKPFRWEELVEFKPEYLANWPAFVSNVSVESASQQACKEIRTEVQRKLPAGISGAGSFFCQGYRLVLFPIWISSYLYKKKTYHLVVNGQTGQVAGDRPLNWFRINLVIATVLAALAFLAFELSHLIQTAWLSIVSPVLSFFAVFKSVELLIIPAILMLLILVIGILRS